jgi:hypothetical protein
MELQEFIESSLVQIGLGIKKAQTKLAEASGSYPIAPAFVDGKAVFRKSEQTISFDVAISVSSDKSLNVSANAIGLGGKGELNKEQSQTHRIQFSVPFYPQALNADNPAKPK